MVITSLVAVALKASAISDLFVSLPSRTNPHALKSHFLKRREIDCRFSRGTTFSARERERERREGEREKHDDALITFENTRGGRRDATRKRETGLRYATLTALKHTRGISAVLYPRIQYAAGNSWRGTMHECESARETRE